MSTIAQFEFRQPMGAVLHRHNFQSGRFRSGLLASVAWAIPVGLASAALCTGIAQAGEGTTDGGFSFARSLNPVESEAYIRTAQLEWLFGERRRQAPPPMPTRAAAPSANPGSTGEGPRYIYVPQRDFFGNVTYQRVLAPESKRMPKIDSKNDKIRHAVAEKLRAAPPAPPTNGPLLITVSIAKQQLTLYDRGVAIAQSPVSSGTVSHPTPTGVFSVLQKQYFHRSNMYSSAPMPYMQRITWAGVALHAGELPGYPASHGCIRLPENFAIRLWGTTQPGVRVIVTQNEVKPVEISHPLLFKPRQPDVPEATPAPEKTPPAPSQPVASSTAPQASHQAPADHAQAAELAAPTPVSLIEEIADAVPVVAEIAIVRGGQIARERASDSDSNVMVGERGMRAERITVVRSGQPVEFQIVDMPPVSHDTAVATPPSNEPAVEKPADSARDHVVDADDAVMSDAPRFALPDLGTMSPVLLAYAGKDFAQFAQLQRRAETEPQAQPAEAPLPVARLLRPGAVSIYISRRQQRLYVRKGFEAVFDMPVTVGRSDIPMGTHVFTANALTDDRTAFRWSVISLADNAFGKRATGDDGKSARAALDRIQLPQEAVARIAEIMDVGATLIVTDKGPGRAQSPDNDFSVVLR